MPARKSKVQPFPSPGNRRRSQRIAVVIPVEVAWHTEAGKYVRKHAETQDVSGHGARLRMDHGLPLRQVIELSRVGIAHWTLARVMRTGPPAPDGCIPVVVEFAAPSKTFWVAA